MELDHIDCVFDELKLKHQQEIEGLTRQMESEIEAIKAEYATMPPAEEEERVIKLVLNAGLLSLKIRSLTKENKKLKASLLAA